MPEHENHWNGKQNDIFMTQQDRASVQLGDPLTDRHGDGGVEGFTFPLVWSGDHGE
eukprot:COSAG05_NODE_901_length_6665_cov_4.080262_2_plen_56_part_00